eukprot:UN10102
MIGTMYYTKEIHLFNNYYKLPQIIILMKMIYIKIIQIIQIQHSNNNNNNNHHYNTLSLIIHVFTKLLFAVSDR